MDSMNRLRTVSTGILEFHCLHSQKFSFEPILACGPSRTIIGTHSNMAGSRICAGKPHCSTNSVAPTVMPRISDCCPLSSYRLPKPKPLKSGWRQNRLSHKSNTHSTRPMVTGDTDQATCNRRRDNVPRGRGRLPQKGGCKSDHPPPSIVLIGT